MLIYAVSCLFTKMFYKHGNAKLDFHMTSYGSGLLQPWNVSLGSSHFPMILMKQQKNFANVFGRGTQNPTQSLERFIDRLAKSGLERNQIGWLKNVKSEL